VVGTPFPPPPRHTKSSVALRFDRVWHELRDGPVALRGLSLTVAPGERVALMGRNGAGKSTLLRHAAGLMKPTRGRVEVEGRVALLLQNPTDYLVHDTVAQETSAGALARFGLSDLADRHPRDLSGGEKQRLALAIVLGDGASPGLDHDPGLEEPAVLCLDEPTRGMDRAAKDELVALLRTIGMAVIVATHDPELAAAFADRVVLLADGAVIADGGAAEVLSGGVYFATETGRILGGAGGALLPEAGVVLLERERVSA
jgi:energy-coupling factor transport system ATP-binding protein